MKAEDGQDAAIFGNQGDLVCGIGFAFHCRIGVGEAERRGMSRILVDFRAETDWREAARTDDPTGIVDYAVVYRRLGELLSDREYRLIETVAETVARALCLEFPVTRAWARVTKQPFDMPDAAGVSVECVRTPADYRGDQSGGRDAPARGDA